MPNEPKDPNEPPQSEAAIALRASGPLAERDDPIAAYMRDLQRYPLLKPEEELSLAKRWHDFGDVAAARSLVTSNLRLVVKIAYEYRRTYRNLLDLVQEGNIGLMQAVEKYDPYRGVKLSSYAAWWIRAYILRFVINNWRLVKLGTTQAQRKLFYNLQKEKARLAAMGIEASAERIAERLQVPAHEVTAMDHRLGAGEVSLDAPARSEESGAAARVELLAAPDEGVDISLAKDEADRRLQATIHRFGDTLDGKDRIIFDKRLLTEQPLTLQELGEEFGVSRERVRQIEKRVLGRLKQFMQQELGDELIDIASPA